MERVAVPGGAASQIVLGDRNGNGRWKVGDECASGQPHENKAEKKCRGGTSELSGKRGEWRDELELHAWRDIAGRGKWIDLADDGYSRKGAAS